MDAVNGYDRYEYYYRQILVDAERYKSTCSRLVFGYASDLDVLIEWNSETFRQILAEYLTEEPAIGDYESIDSMASFARIVSYYMLRGLGGEIEITNGEVVETLRHAFKTQYALGGTCAQGAAALGTMGFPSIVHITDRSKEVCGLMDGLGIEVIDRDAKVPIMEGATDAPPVQHLIFQYPKGAKIEILGKEYVSPLSNRLIMDYDRIHKYVPIDAGFLDYCEEHAKDILAYSTSGFNSIVDPHVMETLVEKLSSHYQKVKEKNPDCTIYLESAHYMSSVINDIVYERFADSVDLLGMNEEELYGFTRKVGMDADLEDVESVLASLEFVLEKYPLTGIVLHTKDYAMYYGDDIEGVDFIKGLTLGNLMASTRARIGRYGTYADCGETLTLPLSPVGIAFHEQLAKIHSRRLAYIVPARYMEHPTFTIGLGDTFVAGFMIAFVR
jgi:ADP-dependent phosphofructokinase/glucokinase